MTPEECPNCGADVPPRARACPECGADEETGWSERARAQELGLPDDEFDYDEFVKNEFGDGQRGPKMRPHGVAPLWWIVAIVLVIMFALWFFGQF